MRSLTKSRQLDVRLTRNGFNTTLELFIATSIHIRLSELKESRHHIPDLPSLMVGLLASYNRKGYLFVSVFPLLYIYKSNSLAGSYKESTSRPFRLL
jgi:hypothetical protein